MTLNSIQSNQLINASSPYLLQHANNPVHWQEWSKKTLSIAQDMDKPILLSIGYAACHWCHVMAHESFEDEKTAAIMNDLFINIKVDREERPDIDQIYMSALHALGESGGWPLTMFLKPDGTPFWGGTYFPPVSAHGRPGFSHVLKSIHKAFQENKSDIDKNSMALKNHLERLSQSKESTHLPDKSTINEFAQKTLQLYDPLNGGMRGAPKFPNAPFLEIWARAAKNNIDNSFAEAFIKSIKEISLGGIYDHLAGGIARYTVDEKWLVPHFEKMLYDNAHYLKHLLLAWQLTGDKLFRSRIEETVSWLTQEMLQAEGGFASSLDADSEGEEGKYYTWQHEEAKALLDEKILNVQFLELYGITKKGNWEGKNILNLSSDSSSIEKSLTSEIQEIRNIFLDKRNKRIRPGLDDKILVDWNGYLISSLAEVAASFSNEKWLNIAKDGYRFISESNCSVLFHSYRNGNFIKPALTTDYAAMINAGLSLYEATQNHSYLNDCEHWFAELEINYSDDNGGYYLTSVDAADLPVRPRADQDEANPSASSQLLEAFIRYANLSGDHQYFAKAERLVKNQEAISQQNRYGMAGYINGLDSFYNHIHFIVCGNEGKEKTSLLDQIRKFAIPAKTICMHNPSTAKKYKHIDLPEVGDKPCVIVCSDRSCSKPIYDIASLKNYMPLNFS